MSTTKLRAELDAIDIVSAERRLADAEAERNRQLLTGLDDDVIAAEAEITRARIGRDRAVARAADLERQIAEAAEAEKLAAFQSRYDDAARLADEATAAITEQFPSFAVRIIDIAEKEKRADEALARVNAEIVESGIDLPTIESPASRVWGRKFFRSFTFRDIISLPETAGNPAHGAASLEVTMEAAVALGGVGQPPAVPAYQFR